jgi:hypothetical protein
MKTSATRILTTAAALWIAPGLVAGVSYAASCISEASGNVALDYVAVCVELPLFWFVLWMLLGVACGFPLYYWLNRRQRDLP